MVVMDMEVIWDGGSYVQDGGYPMGYSHMYSPGMYGNSKSYPVDIAFHFPYGGHYGRAGGIYGGGSYGASYGG